MKNSIKTNQTAGNDPGADASRTIVKFIALLTLLNWAVALHFVSAAEVPEALVLLGHAGVVECLAFSADGNHLVSGDNTGVVRLWPSVQEISRNERGLK